MNSYNLKSMHCWRNSILYDLCKPIDFPWRKKHICVEASLLFIGRSSWKKYRYNIMKTWMLMLLYSNWQSFRTGCQFSCCLTDLFLVFCYTCTCDQCSSKFIFYNIVNVNPWVLSPFLSDLQFSIFFVAGAFVLALDRCGHHQQCCYFVYILLHRSLYFPLCLEIAHLLSHLQSFTNAICVSIAIYTQKWVFLVLSVVFYAFCHQAYVHMLLVQMVCLFSLHPYSQSHLQAFMWFGVGTSFL